MNDLFDQRVTELLAKFPTKRAAAIALRMTATQFSNCIHRKATPPPRFLDAISLKRIVTRVVTYVDKGTKE